MLFRNCAGGVVFYQDRVLLLENEKNEWVLPKGVVREGTPPRDVASERVRVEAGVDAEIISTAGGTSYEFYSLTRRQPVANEIVWFVMRAKTPKCTPNRQEGFADGGFFPVDKAIRMITYSQDKSLVRIAYDKYKELAPKTTL